MRAYLVALGLFQIWIACRLYNEAKEFKVTNVVCETFNESWWVFHNCRLKARSRNLTTLHINGSVLHPANIIHVDFRMFKKANGYKPWVINGNIDVCQFLVKPFNPAAIMIFRLFREYTNFNHPCPFMGIQYIHGFYPNWKNLPIVLPTGDYLLALNWSFSHRVIFTTNVYFVYTEDLKSNL